MSKVLTRGVGSKAVWSSIINTAIQGLQSSETVSADSAALMAKYKDTFAQMAADVVAAVGDGFQLSDLRILAKLVPELMSIAKEIEQADAEQKRQFVVDSVYLIYRAADSGPDGKQNRFKVPLLNYLSYLGITTTEEKFEQWLITLVTECVIEVVMPYLEGKESA
jgi:hypothetical protein